MIIRAISRKVAKVAHRGNQGLTRRENKIVEENMKKFERALKELSKS